VVDDPDDDRGLCCVGLRDLFPPLCDDCDRRCMPGVMIPVSCKLDLTEASKRTAGFLPVDVAETFSSSSHQD
jgi:hypothetical protein